MMRRMMLFMIPLPLIACQPEESAPVDNTVEEVTPDDTVVPPDGVPLADPAAGSVTAPAPGTAHDRSQIEGDEP